MFFSASCKAKMLPVSNLQGSHCQRLLAMYGISGGSASENKFSSASILTGPPTPQKKTEQHEIQYSRLNIINIVRDTTRSLLGVLRILHRAITTPSIFARISSLNLIGCSCCTPEKIIRKCEDLIILHLDKRHSFTVTLKVQCGIVVSHCKKGIGLESSTIHSHTYSKVKSICLITKARRILSGLTYFGLGWSLLISAETNQMQLE